MNRQDTRVVFRPAYGGIATVDIPLDRFGVFGVGCPLNEHGRPMYGRYSLYHIPTGLMLVPVMCTNQQHMIGLARMMRDGQYHARAWKSIDTRQLLKDRRVADHVARLWERVRECPTCTEIEAEEIDGQL